MERYLLFNCVRQLIDNSHNILLYNNNNNNLSMYEYCIQMSVQNWIKRKTQLILIKLCKHIIYLSIVRIFSIPLLSFTSLRLPFSAIV